MIKKVEISGVNTSKLPVIKEKKELIIKMREGDKKARETFIQGNLRLVLSVIQRFNNRGENVDDLFQVGCIGLMKAIDNFDLEQNVKFSTYAVPMIIGEVKRYLRDSSSLRIARSVKDIAYKSLKKKEELTNLLGKEPSVSLIAQELGYTEYEVANALDSIKETVSMAEAIYNDGGDTIYLEDQLEDKKDEMYNMDIKIALKDAINKLKEKEKYIILERYIIGKTQMELAEEIGISQAQISRLEKNGLDNIKRMIN